ncbi:alpha-2-macroglobulin family protein [Primorskyibacter sp. S87]|uniref:alpha-2-macroglobulin family protein n=1 Tax=Primorskyibacter sp. S87 TaxID=3415126 RepID=UPI003C7A7067
MTRILFSIFVILFSSVMVQAQDIVPQSRLVGTAETDFYGEDLDALFDTDLDSCIRACAANSACRAFTFNNRAGACFPKRGVSRRDAFEGAVSAEKVDMDPDRLQAANARVSDLDFLRDEDLKGARHEADTIGLRHLGGIYTTGQLVIAYRERAAAGDELAAMGWAGAAVAVSDRADLWVEYARSLTDLESSDRQRQSDFRNRAVAASINGYLRADVPETRATALMVLASALEAADRGRDAIPALRLAQAVQGRDEIAQALDAAIAKYGFRVVENSVESDTAAPRICVQFSDPLVQAGVDYEPYVQLPEPGLVVQPDGNQLCVDGLDHGARYRLTLREGLPSESGEVLHKSVELTQYVRDRTPDIRFPGRAYVLPRTADAALPIEAVNLSRVELVLRRVSDRNLLRSFQEGYFGRPLNHWEEESFSTDIAEEIWTGSAELPSELNRNMTTRLPLGEAIADQPTGIYALSARIPGADPYEQPGATQWFVLTDLGLSTLSGSNGLHVSVRSLADASAREGVTVRLISRANAILAETQTGEDGWAVFAPGLTRGSDGSAPALITVEDGDLDFAFLALTDPAFDLSDRGVEGRAPAGPVDVFLATDRGAYRAGETIHVTALARDSDAQAIRGLPLMAVLKRPDGVEYQRKLGGSAQAGGHVFSMATGQDVPRGTWRLEILGDPKGPVLASQTVLVEDFLPERIDFDLAVPDAPLRPGDSPVLSIDARYLFGAPGSDLSIDGQVRLTATSELAEWPGYHFGRYDTRSPAQASYFGDERTDPDGRAAVSIEIPPTDSVGQPLQAEIIARLADGSARPVERRVTVSVRPDTSVIGIKPLFDDVVSEGSEARFEVIALSPDLTPVPMQVRWTLNRVETHYQWYQLYGNWNWEPVTRRTRIATGEAGLDNEPLIVSHPVDWGHYELVVERTGGSYTAASRDFYAGWHVTADASSTPDRLEISLDRESYAPGDTAMLRVVPRTAGTAQVTVLSDKVISRQAVKVPAGESTIPVPVTQEWGTGAYVTVSHLRAMDPAAGQLPTRSLGLAHAYIDPEEKALSVAIEVPDQSEPRQTVRAKVTATGGVPGDQVWLTLAAVDVGILNLTGFESPDPQAHYFGQRRLGVEIRDMYGRLIDGMNGALGTVRSGGDANAGMRMQSPPPQQELMARFSGPVELGPEGEALIDFDLPSFNGSVRLMAVAWSQSGVGQAEAEMIVRDPIVVTATAPRFLAPGDQSRILLEVVHADGPEGQVHLEITGGDGLTIGEAPGPFQLAAGRKERFEIPVTATATGDPAISIALTTPDGRELTQNLIVPVRANDPAVARTRRFELGAQDSFTLTDDVFSGLRAGTGRAIVSAGPLAKFDVPGLLATLDRYPYGCTEQVTSQALPLLYLSSVAQAAGLGDGPAVNERISMAISRVLARQAANGAFGLWRAESGDFWLDAYVSDFLSRARAQGHPVPDRAFALAMDNLRNRVNYAPDFDQGGEDIAYALMVLAREGAAAIGDLRYYADVKGEAFTTSLSAAQMGAALAAYGDQTRADLMFARAARMVATPEREGPYWRADYGTGLRDRAGLLALASEAGSAVIDKAVLTDSITTNDTLSTQEASWTLLAAQALVSNPESSGLLVDGVAVDGPFVRLLSDDNPVADQDITTADGQVTNITLTTIGVPESLPGAGGVGYAIARRYLSMDGELLGDAPLRVGDRFVTMIEIRPFELSGARLMINDPLPAGIEIDNPALLRSGDVAALDWLNLSEATHTEFRSDRFLAAVDHSGRDTITLAYVARAVSPGEFHHPAASVEDMYRPRYRARTDTGRVVITP